jgi:hypothetical protein
MKNFNVEVWSIPTKFDETKIFALAALEYIGVDWRMKKFHTHVLKAKECEKENLSISWYPGAEGIKLLFPNVPESELWYILVGTVLKSEPEITHRVNVIIYVRPP